MSQSKVLGKLLTVIGSVIAALALLAPAALAAEPAPGYEQFAGCPTKAENAETSTCLRSDITGGHINMGNKEVPITKTVTLVGGATGSFENFAYNSEGGLIAEPQKVPGGVIGLTGLTWLLEFFGSEALTLYADPELAGVPSEFNFESVTFPLKFHLTNPGGLLGNTCYIGSDSEPITLHLTTGTTEPPPPNEPISGQEPETEIDFLTGIVRLSEGIYVDNSFAAPGANGCKLVLFGFIPISINGLVNEASELPSPAGTNEAVQEYSLEFVGREKVYPGE